LVLHQLNSYGYKQSEINEGEKAEGKRNEQVDRRKGLEAKRNIERGKNENDNEKAGVVDKAF
jgi:hypothetical protein